MLITGLNWLKNVTGRQILCWVRYHPSSHSQHEDCIVPGLTWQKCNCIILPDLSEMHATRYSVVHRQVFINPVCLMESRWQAVYEKIIFSVGWIHWWSYWLVSFVFNLLSPFHTVRRKSVPWKRDLLEENSHDHLVLLVLYDWDSFSIHVHLIWRLWKKLHQWYYSMFKYTSYFSIEMQVQPQIARNYWTKNCPCYISAWTSLQ